ncbi:MAG: hypothetical protein ACLPVY_14275, partial [Acidimicrobiia bacterium]
MHDTPSRTLSGAAAEFGLTTIDQRVPFQRSIRVLAIGPGPAEFPTATQFVALVHDTADNALWDTPDGLGVATIDHDSVAPTGDATARPRRELLDDDSISTCSAYAWTVSFLVGETTDFPIDTGFDDPELQPTSSTAIAAKV